MTLNIGLGLMRQVVELAKQAGEEIMKVYNSGFTVKTKADDSPVTQADRIAETLITETIKKKISAQFPVVGEEAFADGKVADVTGTPFWLVDALDGTKEFVKLGSEFTVNIALIDIGKPMLGVVHAPAINATYWGSCNGAFAETDGAQPRQINCRRRPGDGLVAMVSRSHRTPQVDEYLAQFTIKKEISSGSSIKFCQVAAGRADIYPRMGRTMEWDTGAGHAVLIYAGGQAKDLDGNILKYGKQGFENPSFVAMGVET